jgi:phage terminase small subunit
MGRPAIPYEIYTANGRPHQSNKDLNERRDSEIKIEDEIIVCPPEVRAIPFALRKWKEISRILINSNLLKASDVSSLSRYCITYSEYIELINLRSKASSEEPEEEEEIVIENMELYEKGVEHYRKMWKKIEWLMSTEYILKIDQAINQKQSTLMAFEDRFFLNILSRYKHIFKKDKSKAEEMRENRERSGFGNV